MGRFSIFLYTFAINCVTAGARKKPFEYMFYFSRSEQCIKIISSRKTCGLISSVCKKCIPSNTTSTFQGSLEKIQLGHHLYNHCTRLWPTKWYKNK